jgi:hypothetical protein
MKPNGTVLLAFRPALMERFSKMVSVSVLKASLNKMESASTTQFAKMEPNGTASNVSVFYATQEVHTTVVADVAKPQSSFALLVLIGTVTDVST